jgi:hypothetical protein
MDNQDSISRVTEPILREYQSAFKSFRETITIIPDDEWTRGDKPGQVPVRLVCHALFTLDAKSGGHQVKASTRFGAPVGTFNRIVSPEAYPNRQAVLAYIDDVEKQTQDWVTETARKALSGVAKYPSPMNAVLYYLRHTIVHLANPRWEMDRRGIQNPDYS